MNDPEFRGKLKDRGEARKELQKARAAVVKEMTAKIDAIVKELGTNDPVRVRKALADDPEWRELYKRCSDANTALTEHRRKTNAIVGERLRPPRPAAAPASAKKISVEKKSETAADKEISK